MSIRFVQFYKKRLTIHDENDNIFEVKKITYADVSELADETDSKSVVLMDVWVRVPPSALEEELSDYCESSFCIYGDMLYQ